MEKLRKSLTGFVVPLLSILLAFVIGAIIMAAMGSNPATALGALFQGAFGTAASVGTTLNKAVPLIFTSLCACIGHSAFQPSVRDIMNIQSFRVHSHCRCHIRICRRIKCGIKFSRCLCPFGSKYQHSHSHSHCQYRLQESFLVFCRHFLFPPL